LLLWPDNAMTVLCYGFGGVLILAGILQTVIYIAGEKKGIVQKLMLLSGFIAAVVGVWLLFSPDKVRTLAMIVMGIVLLYHGGMDIKYAFDIKNCGGRTWTAALFFGIATCAVGVLMLVNPFKTEGPLFLVAGIGFLFDGITDFFTSFAVGTSKARYERLAGSAPVIELEPGAAQTLPMEGNTAATPALSGETAEPAAEQVPAPAETAPAPEQAPEPSASEPIAVTLEEAMRDNETPKE
ncbi:MAG: DUF308 domain-containing protein, partial [Oscillospiraceae bacterium]|nr:DUF308 domain-containing protein [Oscillospiraceae bacterium]